MLVQVTVLCFSAFLIGKLVWSLHFSFAMGTDPFASHDNILPRRHLKHAAVARNVQKLVQSGLLAFR